MWGFLRRLAAAGPLLAAALSCAQAQTNVQASVLTLSASPAGLYTSTDQSNVAGRSVQCLVNLSSVGLGTVSVALQGRDPASGAYYYLAGTPALIGGTVRLSVGPGITTPPLGGLTANDNLPATWRVAATVLGTASTSATGTVGCSTIR